VSAGTGFGEAYDVPCCDAKTPYTFPNGNRVTWYCTLPVGHAGHHVAAGSAIRGEEHTWPDQPAEDATVAYLTAERRDGKWLIGDEWSTEHATLEDARAHLQLFGTRGYDMGILAVTLVEVTA
jgi:hypothetical protein